ncbi:LysE family translocator [Sulfurimonas lithotrophica]|uniref:LysE family translocator n=1 Tax=Sulfurimonas lithotrophica TaxID=2590022 RepID=UPI001F5267B2|nr:LysE family translocator [Sulfurimonas lithotrophica]
MIALSFVEGFLLGLGAAVPLGPINILIMNEAVKRYKNGVLIGLGAMSADMLYLLFIVFGLISFVNQPIVLDALSIFGGSFLIYLAYLIFKNKDAKIQTPQETIKHPKNSTLYLKGFTLTLINPYTIGFWLSASGYVAAKELDTFFTIFGMLGAILLWITVMPYLVHKAKHKISQNVSYWISVISAFLLFGFGIMMFINLLAF